MIADTPWAAQAAPTKPPIRACDELEGSARRQVVRFQTIAPIRAENTTVVVVAWVETMPLAIVVATRSEMKAPAKFRSAEKTTASRGGIARVEIVVATAFAVSWKPFVKSKASAVKITTINSTSLIGAGGYYPRRPETPPAWRRPRRKRRRLGLRAEPQRASTGRNRSPCRGGGSARRPVARPAPRLPRARLLLAPPDSRARSGRLQAARPRHARLRPQRCAPRD